MDANTVLDFVGGQMAPEGVLEVERHLDECAACRHLLAELAADVLAPLPEEPVPSDSALLQSRGRELAEQSPLSSDLAVDLAVGPLPAGQRPRTWWRAVVIAVTAAAAAVTVGLTAWTLGRGAPEHEAGIAACVAPLQRELGAVWQPEQAEGIERALGRILSEQSRHTAADTANHLARYARLIVASRDRACRASGDTALKRSTNAVCLDQRIRLLRALVAEASAPAPELAPSLYRVTQELAPVELCDDVEATVGAPELPAEPDAGAALLAIYRDIIQVRALRHAGRLEQARDRAEALVQAARALGFGPALAEALVIRGSIEDAMRKHASAEATLMEAIAEAEAGRAEHLRAEALVALTSAIAEQPGREEEARRIAALASSAVTQSYTGAYLGQALKFAAGAVEPGGR